MKLLILISTSLAVASSINYEEEERKYHQNLAEIFEKHLVPFNKRLALEANYYTRGHFIISSHNIWHTLGPETNSNKELFSFLNLPNDESVRQQFYGRVSILGDVGEHYTFSRSRAMAVDEIIDVKKDWVSLNDVPAGMPDYLRSLKYEKPFGRVQKYVENHHPNMPYSGHMVLLDHVMFDSIGSPAFSGRAVLKGPFYNEQGEKIGTVEYLRMKDKFRVAYFPGSNVTVIEIPIGSDINSSMLFAVGGKAEDMIETVFSRHIFSDLKLTERPIDVAIPKLSMSSAIEMRTIFNNMRRSKEFSRPATRNLAELPELPMGYYHMVTVNVTESSARTAFKDSSNEDADFAALEKEGFIVNRPFLFSLFVPLDLTEVRVPVFTGVYSFPGERGQQKLFEELYYFD